MSVIIILLTLTTVAQLFTCGFSLWFIVSLICRVLFMLRSFGIIFKTKPLFAGEIVSMSTMAVWYFLFHKDAMPWGVFFLTILLCLLTIFLEWLDGMLYVYEVIDEDEL